MKLESWNMERQSMNPNLPPPLTAGRTAEIYHWRDQQILKLFFAEYDQSTAAYEAQIAQALQTAGLPVPAVYELVEVNGRWGIVYERLEGISMWELLLREPQQAPYCAQRMAELHSEMHTHSLDIQIPAQRERLTRKIQHAAALPADLQTKAVAALAQMSTGGRLCHGDFHPANILMTPNGEKVIDWMDASLGNPLADLARTTIIALGVAETNQIEDEILKTAVPIFHNTYIDHYFKLNPGGEAEYQQWLPIVAAARLSENIPEVEQWLIAQVERGFTER